MFDPHEAVINYEMGVADKNFALFTVFFKKQLNFKKIKLFRFFQVAYLGAKARKYFEEDL